MSIHDDQDDSSENLADMIQLMNSKIEQLLEDSSTYFDQLPNKVEEPFCEGHSSDLESGHSSNSEPDPEEPSSPKVEGKEIDALYEISFEKLLATCNALLRENQSLKMELAAVKTQKTLDEMDAQPSDAQFLLQHNETLTRSSSVNELTSPETAPQACLALPIRPRMGQSNGEPVPDSVITYTSAPSAWELEEYVQYHKEPMAGGWREFYTPRDMYTPSTKFFTPRSMPTPSRKLSRRGSKSVHVYRRHSSSGLALQRSVSLVEDQ
jgi:hypothetical protein